MTINDPATINSLEKTITNLESEIKIKNEKIDSLEETVSELTNKLAQTKKEVDISIDKLKNEYEEKLEEKNQIISDLRKSLSNMEAENKKLHEEISKKLSEISELLNKIPELENQISENESEIENFKSQRDKLQELFKAKEAIFRQKDEVINELNDKISEMTTEIEFLKKQIPKKSFFKKTEEVIKGAQCPRCGMATYEEYKDVKGIRTLIRKYCPNTSCGWTVIEKPEISIMPEAGMPEENIKKIKLFRVEMEGLEEEEVLNSKIVVIIVDPAQETVWIWRGKDSDRFKYVEATRQSAIVKNEIMKNPYARIERVEEGEEPADFPKLKLNK